MSYSTLKRISRGALPVVALLLLLLAALHLMSDAVQNSAEMDDRMLMPLLLFILLGLVALLLLVIFSITQLIIRYRREVAGSRLTLRLMVMFVVLSLAPVSIVYFYSQQFLLRGIDNWFDVEVDQAMEDALGLSRASLDLHRRELLKITQRITARLTDSSVAGLTLLLDEERERYSATELALMEPSGRVITSSNADPTVLVPDRPDDYILQQVRASGTFVGLIPKKEQDAMLVRVLVSDTARQQPVILQALFPTTETIGDFTENLQASYNRYKELFFLRGSLKNMFIYTLALVLLFSLLAAIWAAIVTARRLVAPVANIAEGTKAVAGGDYDTQLPLPKSRDELSFLVSSFNEMTRGIAQARDEADRSQEQVEQQRAYLETVLGHLSSGVITFDTESCLRTGNAAASQILGISCDHYLGKPLEQLVKEPSSFGRLMGALEKYLLEKGGEWQGEVTLYGREGRQILLCRGTPLMSPEGAYTGQVLVFDDVTALIQAQRDAAWGEVARRLAHEIKNPLTPIQLSAERLRRKYLEKMELEDTSVLDRATHTIVQQVEAMQAMVNTFSDYANPPKMSPEPIAVDEFLKEVLELYQPTATGPLLEMDLNAQQARIEGDPVRMRQVIHNLIKNSIEAVGQQKDGRIRVVSHKDSEGEHAFVEISVIDNGPGFAPDSPDHLFEPYVTTKTKGTGLGLAIVKKIIEEHGGMIWAESVAEGGACMVFRIPVKEEGPEGQQFGKITQKDPRKGTH